MRASIGYRPLEERVILVAHVKLSMSNDFGDSATMFSEVYFDLVDQAEGEQLAKFFNDHLNDCCIRPMRIMKNHEVLREYGNGWRDV